MFSRVRLFIVLAIAVFASGAVLMVGAQDATPEANAAVATSFTRFNLNTATYYHPALGKQADVTFPQTAPNRAN